MHPRVSRVLAERKIPRDLFERALADAVARAGDEAQVSPRMQLCAALVAEPGGRLCDVGGSVSLYLVVLKLIGMEVTVVDTLPYLDVAHLQIGGFRDKTLRRLDLFDRLGIVIDRRDVFTAELPAERYDAVCAYETIEHFAQSPKPVLTRMTAALGAGGRLCLSVPNVARLEMRLRVLGGRTPHESYAYYFEHGNPYFGHYREMTIGEMGHVAKALGLETLRLFTTDMSYESLKRKNVVQRAALAFNNRTGFSDMILPTTMRSRVWLEARKRA